LSKKKKRLYFFTLLSLCGTLILNIPFFKNEVKFSKVQYAYISL